MINKELSKLNRKINKIEAQKQHLRDIYIVAIDKDFVDKEIRRMNVELRALYEEKKKYECRDGVVHHIVV